MFFDYCCMHYYYFFYHCFFLFKFKHCCFFFRPATGETGVIYYLRPRGSIPGDLKQDDLFNAGGKKIVVTEKIKGWFKDRELEPRRFACCKDCSRWPYLLCFDNPFPNHSTVWWQVTLRLILSCLSILIDLKCNDRFSFLGYVLELKALIEHFCAID